MCYMFVSVVTPVYKQVLQDELVRRCKQNPRYSLRAFSRALEVDIGVLSRVLAGKRTLSYGVADRITNALGLSPIERRYFIDSIAEEQKNKKIETPLESTTVKFEEVESDIFQIIGDWYHYAILELTTTVGFKNDVKWIAKKFGLSNLQVRLALERLQRVGLLKSVDGRLEKATVHFTTNNKHQTSGALRSHQKQMLSRAFASLDGRSLKERDMTGMTMAIDPAKLPIAKEMIQEFSKRLCSFLESGKKKNVYQVQISLFPLEEQESVK